MPIRSSLHQRAIAFLALGALAVFSHAEEERLVLPVFGSQPDTGVQFGVAAFWNESAAADARALNVFAIATEQGQARGVVSGRYPGVVSGRSDYFTLSLQGSYFPSQFYGYRSDYIAAGYGYEERSWGTAAGWFYPLGTDWRVGGELLYRDESIRFDDPGVSAVRSAEGTNGDRYRGVRVTVIRNTRDQDSWPEMGSLAETEAEWVVPADGPASFRASQSFAYYLPVVGRGVLALGGQLQAATEETPFTWMPTLSGSQWLRGVEDGQFRHHFTHAEQAELRWPLTDRFATVAFLHQGQVGASPEAWSDAVWQRGGGAGLRYSVSQERRQNIRLDVGWVNGRSGVVISFGEAF